MAGNPHLLRVQPCRYAAYIAALAPGKKDGHGPMRFIEPENLMSASSGRGTKEAGQSEPFTALQGHKLGDASRNFWVPLHKLFEGNECLRGRTLSVRLSASHVNEKLRRAHLFFLAHGHNGGWFEPDISKPPFVLTEQRLRDEGAVKYDVVLVDGRKVKSRSADFCTSACGA